jgi:hypothetical protein
MKKAIAIISATVFLFAGTALTSCNSPEEKVENAAENVAEAHDDLDNANQDYVKEVDNYRTEIAQRTNENNTRIAEMRSKANDRKAAAREDYNRRIDDLDRKNAEMKVKLDNYKAGSKENWENFRIEFNRDMDELGNAFSDLGKDNVQ